MIQIKVKKTDKKLPNGEFFFWVESRFHDEPTMLSASQLWWLTTLEALHFAWQDVDEATEVFGVNCLFHVSGWEWADRFVEPLPKFSEELSLFGWEFDDDE